MLSKRLQTVLKLIDINDHVADIGCDHGYLGLYALKKGLKRFEFVDNKVLPLKTAKTNLAKYLDNVNLKLTFVLADGLTKLSDDINAATICGMGGDMIIKIISDNLNKAQSLDYLILAANTKIEELRTFLDCEHFQIVFEEIVFDHQKYYQIIKVTYQENYDKLSEKALFYGPILTKELKITNLAYFEKEYERINKIISSCNDDKKIILKQKISYLKEIINETKRNNEHFKN